MGAVRPGGPVNPGGGINRFCASICAFLALAREANERVEVAYDGAF